MYVIEPVPERVLKIYLCCRGSSSRVFYGLEDLCEDLTLDFVERFVGRNYGDLIKIVTARAHGLVWDAEKKKFGYKHPEKFHHVEAEFIIRTEDGEKLTSHELKDTYWRIRARLWRYMCPSMGRKACNAYGHYRKPQTLNEKRQAFPNKDDGEPEIRGRRNKNNLPTGWDDYLSHNDACWKTQYKKRKRQYRPR